jgi:hypothetical protein
MATYKQGKMSSSSIGANTGGGASGDDILSRYPGTALSRMENCRDRAASLKEEQLSGDWEDVRGLLLWAAGMASSNPHPSTSTCKVLAQFGPCSSTMMAQCSLFRI